MIYVQFEAMPSQQRPSAENVAGAYVNCWVPTDDPLEAERVGRQWLADQEWLVVRVEELRPVDVAAESQGPGGHYIREAAERGGSMVFHRWPADGGVSRG